MKESDLRKIHRHLGIILALFLFLQGGSGMLLTLGELFTPKHAHSNTTDDHHEGLTMDDSSLTKVKNQSRDEEHGIIGQIHHKEGTVWSFYRVLVGSGLLAMVFSGVIIFIPTRIEQKRLREEILERLPL